MSTARGSGNARLARSAAAVFVLSASVIGLELALMRCMSVARWHHFAYLVISTALLGFGAAGTLLFYLGDALRRRFVISATGLTLAFAVSIPLCYRAAEALPLDIRYVLYSGRQAALMFGYHFLLFVPFLLGAIVIGLSLMHYGERLHSIYAANLVGSGVGALAAVGLMFLLSSAQLLHAVALLGAVAAAVWSSAVRGRLRTPACAATALVALGLLGGALFAPIRLNVDQYKALSTLRRWRGQGSAEHVLTEHGPRARLDAFSSPLLHQTIFAGLTAESAPPEQLALLADGQPVATVFDISSPDEAAILDHTPQSVPYRLLDRPRVLLLGEAGGANVWLARRFGARHITVVQPNPHLIGVLRGPLSDRGGEALSGSDVTVVVGGLRGFLERTDQQYDLIQIVEVEGQAAGASGMLSLREDFLLTVEGMATALRRLAPGGILTVTRGVQSPPRDNVKLFATLRAALRRAGREPGERLVQVRNYLAATTMAFARPPGGRACGELINVARALALDIEWAPCQGMHYTRQRNQVAGPAGEQYSWFHHAAKRLLSPNREAFYAEWVYDVRPATDQRPYFFNFFRWRSLPRFVRAYGRQWLSRLELGYAVLVFALAQVVLVGAVLIVVPVFWLRRRGATHGRAATVGYFICLGLAYLMLEMVCILKFTYFLGDPIYAAAGVLSAFLVFSGLGSALSRRWGGPPRRGILVAGVGIALLASAYAFGLDGLFHAAIGLPAAVRLAVCVLVTAPAAFLMGWPFPGGLTLVERGSPAMVPWAYAVNGFASVAASPLAVMLSIHAGFWAVLLASGALYLVAACLCRGLPSAEGVPAGAPTQR